MVFTTGAMGRINWKLTDYKILPGGKLFAIEGKKLPEILQLVYII